MELRVLLALIKRYALIILLTVVAGVGAVAFWFDQRPPLYQAVLSVVVGYEADENVGREYFAYNNYYGTEVAKSYNESISAQLKNESYVNEIFTAAAVPATKNLGKYFRTTPKSAHVSEIRFQGKQEKDVVALARALSASLQSQAIAFSTTRGEGQIVLSLAGPNVEVLESPILLYLIIIAVALIGLSVLMIICWVYLRGHVLGADALADRLGVPVLTAQGRSQAGLLSIREFIAQLPGPGTKRVGVLAPAGFASTDWLTALIELSPELELQSTDSLAKTANAKIAIVPLPAISSPELTSALIGQVDALVICLEKLSTTEQTLGYLDTLLGYTEQPLGLVTF